MTQELINAVMFANDCHKESALELIQEQVNRLRSLGADINPEDVDDACFDLGIDLDYVEDLILCLY